MASLIRQTLFMTYGLFNFTNKAYNKAQVNFTPIDKDLSGKVVVISGANSGLGYETALNLANRGTTLWLH